MVATKYMSSWLLGLVFIFIISGCSSSTDPNRVGSNGTVAIEGPTLSLFVGDKEVLSKPSDKQLKDRYRKGISLLELLEDSEVATFSEDKRTILSVRDISLGPEMTWELQLDGKVIGNADWDKIVSYDSQVVFTAKSTTNQEPLQTVMLTVNGGSEEVELNHSYVVLFTEDLTVNGLLHSIDGLQLTEDNLKLLSVNGYIPQSDEIWKLKANGKQLLDTGMDMRLRPDDDVEIVLALR